MAGAQVALRRVGVNAASAEKVPQHRKIKFRPQNEIFFDFDVVGSPPG
jgi:hypothetical protein